MSDKIRVMIVEDHEVTLDGLKAGLEKQVDISVVATAENSDKGLSLANSLKPDVILLDLHLPGTRGPKSMVEAFCKIPESRVIIFSGESRMAFVHTVMQVGAAGYLLKSENASNVAESIRLIMSGKYPVISKQLAPGENKLTKAEQHLLKMLARGMKYQDIAEARVTSPATVRKQCELLQIKLELGSREELIAWAVQNGYGNLEMDQ